MTELWLPRRMRASRVSVVAIMTMVSLCCLAAAAWAQPAAFLREYQAGIDAYRLGQYAEARAHLQKAAEIDPKLPGPHRWLAAVDQAEEKWADCVAHAREAIRLNPQSSEIVATRTIHDECRKAAGRMPFNGDFEGGGALAVTSSTSGATVTVNGLRYGVTPMAPRALAAGAIEIVVEKAGWLPRKLEVRILPQVVTDVEVTLERDPAAKPETAVEAVQPAMPTTGWLIIDAGVPGTRVEIDGAVVTPDARGRIEQPPGSHEVIVVAPGHERWRRRVRVARGQEIRVLVTLTSSEKRTSRRRLGIGAVAGATLLAGVGAGFAILAGDAREEAADWHEIERTRPSPALLPLEQSTRIEPLHTRADIEDAVDRADRWALVSTAAYGAAAVSLGVGVYFLIAERPLDRDGYPAPYALVPLIGDGHVGLGAELGW